VLLKVRDHGHFNSPSCRRRRTLTREIRCTDRVTVSLVTQAPNLERSASAFGAEMRNKSDTRVKAALEIV